jgi:predicted metal-dependent phosphoesterase TrpH
VTTTLADPHCHTFASDGMVSPQELVDAAVGIGLGLIAVCDHDTMRSVEAAARYGEEKGLVVVKGQELTTRWPGMTHVIGWFLEGPVRSGMTLADTVAAIHDQGGLAILPHPFVPTYFGACQPGMLRKLIELQRLDGIEVEFTPPMTRSRRRLLEAFYRDHADRLGARIGASDSHFGVHDIARVVTVFEGTTAEDFRRAVVERRTEPMRREKRRVPTRLVAAQQLNSLFRLPLRRFLGQLE